MSDAPPFVSVAQDLEMAGLVWVPEVGDEVSNRQRFEIVSVLVDKETLTIPQLRATYLWLPTVEQMILQLEARQAILFHAGLELSEVRMGYKAVIQAPSGPIEVLAESLRGALGQGLRSLLLSGSRTQLN